MHTSKAEIEREKGKREMVQFLRTFFGVFWRTSPKNENFATLCRRSPLSAAEYISMGDFILYPLQLASELTNSDD